MVRELNLQEILSAVDAAERALRSVRGYVAALKDSPKSSVEIVSSDSSLVRIEVMERRRSRLVTSDEAERMKPENYDIFADFVFDRFGGMRWPGMTVRSRDSGLRPRELLVLAKLMANQNVSIANFRLEDDGYSEAGPEEVAKIICHIRHRLKDDARNPTLIITGSRQPGRMGGRGYCLSGEVKAVLIQQTHVSHPVGEDPNGRPYRTRRT